MPRRAPSVSGRGCAAPAPPSSDLCQFRLGFGLCSLRGIDFSSRLRNAGVAGGTSRNCDCARCDCEDDSPHDALLCAAELLISWAYVILRALQGLHTIRGAVAPGAESQDS